jgi:hypothetical protein
MSAVLFLIESENAPQCLCAIGQRFVSVLPGDICLSKVEGRFRSARTYDVSGGMVLRTQRTHGRETAERLRGVISSAQ